MQAGDEVAGGDETTKKAASIDVAVEGLDAATPVPPAPLPVGARAGIEVRRQEEVERSAIAGHIRHCQHAHDVGARGQVAEGRELQAVQSNVVEVEIDDIDPARRTAEIGKHVAAAGPDRDEAMTGLQVHGGHVHVRVFPDLRIDQSREEQSENPFGEALPAERAVLQERVP